MVVAPDSGLVLFHTVRYARDLRPDDFKNGNAILLGASEADPWIELYEHDLNFVMQDDYKGVFRITNRRPKPGEPSRWESRYDDPQRRVFGVVAYLPSLSGNGSVLLLEGTGTSGAEAGMDLMLDDSALEPFLKQVRRSDGTLPHFELLLEPRTSARVRSKARSSHGARCETQKTWHP